MDTLRNLTTLGRADLLKLVARQGARVAVNYIAQEAAANAVVAAIKEAGEEAFVVQADVGDATAVERMVETLQERWGEWTSWSTTPGLTVTRC